MPITFEEIRHNKEINSYIKQADASLLSLGFTEHSFAHVTHCAEKASEILEKLDYDAHEQELAKIAGYMHDIGNLINRNDHAQTGALMSYRILDKLGMPTEDIAIIMTAIGHHDEKTAHPVNAVTAALILADKSDVRRSRVRNRLTIDFDIHDRVNYAVESSSLNVEVESQRMVLVLTINTELCPVLEYFEIFLERMLLCRKAADFFDYTFKLIINDSEIM